MEIRTRVLDIPANIQVFHISGKIITSFLPLLENKLDDLVKGPPVKLILDLNGVDAIDSQGVGTLIKARNDIIGAGGNVVLMGLTKRLTTVLKISGLTDYFSIAPTEFQAIKILESDAT